MREKKPRRVQLDRPAARRALSLSDEVHWMRIGKGAAVGYRRAAGKVGTWWIRTFKHGRYTKKSLHVEADDERPANASTVWSFEDVRARALDDYAAAKNGSTGPYSVASAIADYFAEDEEKQNLSWAQNRSRIQPFVDRFGDTGLSDLTADDIKRWRARLIPDREPKQDENDYRESRRKAQATANRIWAPIRAALNHAFASGKCESDAEWRRVKPFQNVSKARFRFLNAGECRALLDACPPTFRTLVNAALVTACRMGELQNMTVADVDIAGKMVTVPKGKTDEPRSIPLIPEALAIFSELVTGRRSSERLFLNEAGEPWTKMQISRAMRQASTTAKLEPRATFHDLRRSFAAQLANAGVRDSIIASALGHADTRMVRKHYGHLLDATIAAELTKFLPNFSGKGEPPPKG